MLHFVITCIYNVYFHPLRKCISALVALEQQSTKSHSQSPAPSSQRPPASSSSTNCFAAKKFPVKLRSTVITAKLCVSAPIDQAISPHAWKDVAGAGAGKRLENTKDPSTFGPDIHGAQSMGSQPEAMVHRSQ